MRFCPSHTGATFALCFFSFRLHTFSPSRHVVPLCTLIFSLHSGHFCDICSWFLLSYGVMLVSCCFGGEFLFDQIHTGFPPHISTTIILSVCLVMWTLLRHVVRHVTHCIWPKSSFVRHVTPYILPKSSFDEACQPLYFAVLSPLPLPLWPLLKTLLSPFIMPLWPLLQTLLSHHSSCHSGPF